MTDREQAVSAGQPASERVDGPGLEIGAATGGAGGGPPQGPGRPAGPEVDRAGQAVDPVAAERAGRALNRLRWHLVQVWLLDDTGAGRTGPGGEDDAGAGQTGPDGEDDPARPLAAGLAGGRHAVLTGDVMAETAARQDVDAVAAEQAGQALKCLADTVRDAFQGLAEAARGLRPPHTRAALESVIDAARDEWAGTFRSPSYYRERDALRTCLSARWDAEDDPYALRDDICTTFLSPAAALHARLRGRLLRETDEAAALAFELGELLDRGLRPEGPPWRVRPGADAVPSSSSAASAAAAATDGPMQLRWDLDDAGEASVKEEHQLADRSVAPGEARPDASWPRKVRQLWSELGLPTEVPPEVDRLPGATSVAEAIKLLAGIQAAVSSGLVKLRPSPPDRLTFDKETWTVILDGEPHPIKHPRAFRLFEVVAAARPNVVTIKALEKAGVKDKKPSRLRKYLPKPIDRCLIGRDGKGGGYTVRLPAKPGP
jgi:hypothetical protein